MYTNTHVQILKTNTYVHPHTQQIIVYAPTNKHTHTQTHQQRYTLFISYKFTQRQSFMQINSYKPRISVQSK